MPVIVIIAVVTPLEVLQLFHVLHQAEATLLIKAKFSMYNTFWVHSDMPDLAVIEERAGIGAHKLANWLKS